MALTPGLLLADRYRLTHRIAVGGMGEVWAADDTRLARVVAVKILKSELTSDPEFVDRFRSEARITASLNNPGIAAVYDYGEVASIVGGPRDTAYLVMELVSGEPLSAVLARTPRLSAPRTLDVLEQSGRALQVAHARHLVHRDIKPGNILITPTGQVKITDFGIAKVAHQVPITRGGLVMGTAQYLSPEQAAGREAVPASDIYALGVVAYECLAGRRPFIADQPLEVAIAHVQEQPPPLPPDIPPPAAALVMRMLAKDPLARFPDGASLAAACRAVRSGASPGGAPPASRHPARPSGPYPASVSASAPTAVPPPVYVMRMPPAPPPRRRTGLSWLMVLLMLVITAVVAVILLTLGARSDAAASSAPLFAKTCPTPAAAPATVRGSVGGPFSVVPASEPDCDLPLSGSTADRRHGGIT